MNSGELKLKLNELTALPFECEWVEFKINNSEPNTIGEYISALSNAACLHNKPAAYVVWGVENETHKIIGTNFKPKSTKIGNEELENWLATQLDPRIDFEIFEFSYDKFKIVMFKIGATYNRPVRFKGTAYIRVGSYKKKLDAHPGKAREIWGKRVELSFEREIALSDIDENEALKLLDYPSYFSLLSLNLPDNKEAILDKLKEEKLLIRKHNRVSITNLGAILFAKSLDFFDNLSRKAVRVIIYKGKDKLETIKEQRFGKGYAVGFGELIDYINDQLPSSEVIGKSFRQEVKAYPEIAIRELVANALIHQDFSISGSGPMVEIFSDRIEISNPGKPLIDPLRFIDHMPRSRNEKLASFMRRINICEERGSGIDKVVDSVESNQLPAPAFIEEDTYFRATLYAHKTLRQMKKDDKIRACYQHCCLKYVSSDLMTNQTLRDRFGIEEENYSTASRIIGDAIKADLIKPHDPDNRSKRHAKYVPIWA
ncbi:MAG: putative DNA binding domain-containing protein [Planctomycetes bacterium]|nr:putative DNA binding domain-containing protein [Planctomycetota bacterium]